MISFARGPEYDQRRSIHEQVVRYAFGEPHERELTVSITGSGDPFGSRLFRELLFDLDGAKYPNLQIYLHTNGVAFTEAAWNKLHKIHRNLGVVRVSVDAGSENQYRITRRGGDWTALLRNLEFLGRKRTEHAFKQLILNLVVQRDNYRGIPAFIEIGKRVGADQCALSLLSDWGTWTHEEFAARTVWSVRHPEFERFLRVMADPLLADPIVFLGNTMPYRKEALARFAKSTNALASSDAKCATARSE